MAKQKERATAKQGGRPSQPPQQQGKPPVERFHVLVPYQYEHKGEKKTSWTDVGVAFRSSNGEGVNVELKPGISVSGRLVIRPAKAKEQDGGELDDDDRGPRGFVYSASEPRDLV
jgi:hypothetical protein